MSLSLKIVDGDIYGAYKNNIIAFMLGMRTWKNRFKAKYIAINGIKTIGGVDYFGGRFNTADLSNADKEALVDLIGVDEGGKQEMIATDDSDTRVYVNLLGHMVFSVDALRAHFQYEIQPNVPASTVFNITYTLPNDYVFSTTTTPPALPSPRSMKVAKTDFCALVCNAYAVTGVGDETIDNTMLYTYMLSSFFELHAASVSLTTEYYTYELTAGGYNHYWRTVATIDVGTDTSWISTLAYLQNDLYPDVYISDSESDYKITTSSTGFQSDSALYNYAGLFWQLVNDWTASTDGYYNTTFAPAGTYYVADGAWSSLYIDIDYWDSLTVLEAVVLVSQTANIGAEAIGGGFWSTFVGKFLGTLINAVSTITGFGNSIPVISSMILSLLWTLDLAGYGKISDDVEMVYKKLRTAIMLYFFMAGAELGAESASLGGPFSEAFDAGVQIAAIDLRDMSILELANQFGGDILDAAVSVVSPAPASTQRQDDSTVADKETGELRFEQGIGADLPEDYVEIAYMMMDFQYDMQRSNIINLAVINKHDGLRVIHEVNDVFA